LLRLDSTLARAVLDWQPRWSLAQAHTVAWYQAWVQGADMTAFSVEQIHACETAGPL
jgi:CDP-glucose 4,6-dehydratase